MLESNLYVPPFLKNDWVLELHPPHCLKSRIQAFSDILVWRVRKFVYQSDNHSVSGKALLKYVFRCNVAGESAWAEDLDSVVKDLNVDVICDAVVPMKNGICYNLMDCLYRIYYGDESIRRSY